MFLRKLSDEVGRARVVAPMAGFRAKVFGGLFTEELLALIVNCVTERVCKEGICMFDYDVRMVFVREGFISGGLRPNLKDCGGALSTFEAWKT